MKYNIIKTEKYLLAIDDSEIKEGDWIYESDSNSVNIAGKGYHNFTQSDAKIIAYLPLNNSPVLEGVPLLPPLEDEVEGLAKKHLDSLHNNEDIARPELYDAYHSFKDGYNKAKEKYKYTEEDILNFHSFYMNCNEKHVYRALKVYVQSLQQPKMPVAFKCLTFDTGNDELDGTHILGIRTTTNPQGQTVLVGKYIY